MERRAHDAASWWSSRSVLASCALAVVATLTINCDDHEDYGRRRVAVSIRAGTAAVRTGAAPQPMVDWSPATPVKEISVQSCSPCSPDFAGCNGGETIWQCSGPELAPPVTFGVTPPGWRCDGRLELVPSQTYQIKVGASYPERRNGYGEYLEGYACVTDVAAAIPPETWSQSFEGVPDAFGRCAWRKALSDDIGKVTSGGRTGEHACRLCGKPRGENYFSPAAPGRYTLEAWARRPADATVPYEWFVEIRGGGSGGEEGVEERVYARLGTEYSVARVTVEVPPPGNSRLEARIGQDNSNSACFDVDDIALIRE